MCSLFDDEDAVKISFEEDLIGKNVRATGHFEFTLQRGDKRICIVEAKKDDMDKGLAQILIGCEVASDVSKNRVVYGIVTSLSDWTFLRSCDDKIEKHEVTMLIRNNAVDPDSLKEIIGKIYAMLSND